MHERSISHRDLKTSNILILGDPEADPPELSLIDLVGVVHLAEHVHHRAARDGFDLEWDKFEGPVLRHFGLHEEDLADIIEEFASPAG